MYARMPSSFKYKLSVTIRLQEERSCIFCFREWEQAHNVQICFCLKTFVAKDPKILFGVMSEQVDVTDTVGCGDSFVAAVAFGFIHNLPLVHTLTVANAVGAATATGCGAGRNVASLDQVLDIMRISNLNEDDGYWNEVFGNFLDTGKISMLSNGRVLNSQLQHLPVQKVVHEVLERLKLHIPKELSDSFS